MQRCQRETTSSEFVAWQQFFQQEQTEPKREHYYLAQIVLEIRRLFAKNPQALKLEHFLLKFGKAAPALSPEERAQQSKNSWFGITGLKGKLKTRKPPPQPPK